jgi:hypothetical protein
VNISIPLRGSPYSNSAVLLVGIRLLHIGFQIDECAKSLTGPFGRPTMGWLLTTGGPVGQPQPPPLAPRRKNKQMLPLVCLNFRTDNGLTRLFFFRGDCECVCAQQGKRPQTNEIVFSVVFSFYSFLCQRYRCRRISQMLAHFCKLKSHNPGDRDGSQFMIHGCCRSHTQKKSRGNEPTRLYDDL